MGSYWNFQIRIAESSCTSFVAGTLKLSLNRFLQHNPYSHSHAHTHSHTNIHTHTRSCFAQCPGALNKQGFVLEYLYAPYINFHPFIYSPTQPPAGSPTAFINAAYTQKTITLVIKNYNLFTPIRAIDSLVTFRCTGIIWLTNQLWLFADVIQSPAAQDADIILCRWL